MKKILLSIILCLSLLPVACSAQEAIPQRDFGDISLSIPENWTVREEGNTVTFIGPNRKSGATIITARGEGETAKQMAEGLAMGFGGNSPQKLTEGVYLVKIPAPAIPESMKRGLQVSDQDLEARMFVSESKGFFLIVGFFGRDPETYKVVRSLKGLTKDAQSTIDKMHKIDFNKF